MLRPTDSTVAILLQTIMVHNYGSIMLPAAGGNGGPTRPNLDSPQRLFIGHNKFFLYDKF